MYQLRPQHTVWFVVYVAVMAALAWYLVQLRTQQMTRLDQPAARQAWQAWRAAAKQQAGDAGPVKRKVPKSSEPPALVLLRDHFPVVIAAGFVFGTALFCLGMFTVYGTLSRRQHPTPRTRAEAETEEQPRKVKDPQEE